MWYQQYSGAVLPPSVMVLLNWFRAQCMVLVVTIPITIKMIMRLVVAAIFHNSCQDSNFLCFPQRAAASYLRTTLWRADNVMHWAFVPFRDPWTKSQKFVWGPFAGPGIGLNQSEAIQNCLTRQVQMYTEQEGMPRLWNFSWLLALCHWNSPIDIAITLNSSLKCPSPLVYILIILSPCLTRFVGSVFQFWTP